MTMETVQMKVSGLMCLFCTMSLEKALKRYPGSAAKNILTLDYTPGFRLH